jgi:hypothetical protein
VTIGGAEDRSRRLIAVLALTLIAAGIASRTLISAEPYFADGPAHIEAVSSGRLFIQPPGYYLFAKTATALTRLGFHAAEAIRILNSLFTLFGSVAFFFSLRRLGQDPMISLLGAANYCFLNVVWFSSMIHSTYASQAFFGPALFLAVTIGSSKWFLVGCAVWALGAGFRPSDGVFLLPLLAWAGMRLGVRWVGIGMVVALLVGLTWWIPTAMHYGGFFAPIHVTREWVSGVNKDVSVLRAGLTKRSMANVARFVVALLTSFPILWIFAVRGLVARGEVASRGRFWVLPGAAFLSLSYMSDAPYITFLAGGVLLLAVEGMRGISRRLQVAIQGAALAFSLGFFLLAKPVEPSSFPRRVMNAFSLEYTKWAIEHRYKRNLSDLEREAGGAVPWLEPKTDLGTTDRSEPSSQPKQD